MLPIFLSVPIHKKGRVLAYLLTLSFLLVYLQQPLIAEANHTSRTVIQGDPMPTLYWDTSSGCIPYTSYTNYSDGIYSGWMSLTGNSGWLSGGLRVMANPGSYTFGCSNGPVSHSATLNVNPCTSPTTWNGSSCAMPAAPSVNLSANNYNPTYNTPVLLSWTVSNATNCSINGIGGVSASGGSTWTPNITSVSSYTITCNGPGGSNSSNVVISPGPAPQPPTINWFTNNGPVSYGGGATLSWSVTNAVSCSISSIGGVSNTGGSVGTGALTFVTTYTLTCTNPQGSDSAQTTVSVNSPPPPVISIWANNPSPPFGTGTTINWNNSGGPVSGNCTASGPGGWAGTRPSSGSYATGNLTSNQTYTITCSGPGGSDTVQVDVIPGGAPAPSLSLSASPTTITQGNSSQLNWTVSGTADSCWASNNIGDSAWDGWKSFTGGSQSVSPWVSGTYSLECWNAGVSSGQDSVTISVNAAPQPPTIISFDNDGPVTYGDSATLSWNVAGATSCSISGLGGVNASGGSRSTGSVTSDTTYTLTCSNPQGSDSAQTTVSVNSPPPPVMSIWADDPSPPTGTGTTINWNNNGGPDYGSCTASGPGGWAGTRPSSGSYWTGNLFSNQTYTISCSGPGGNDSAQVDVIPGGASAPTLNFWGSPTSITSGNSSQLNWTVSGTADSCWASNNIGDSAWDGWKSFTGGSQSVSPWVSGTYSLECWNAGVSSGQQDETIFVNAGPPSGCSGGLQGPYCSLVFQSTAGVQNGTCVNGSSGNCQYSCDPSTGVWTPRPTQCTAPSSGCPSGPVSGAPECNAPGGATPGDTVSAACSSGYSGSGCNLRCDSGGASDYWTVIGRSCNAPIITDYEICDATLTTCVTGGGTITVPPGGTPGGQIIVRWDSDNASNCSALQGTGFVTGGAPTNMTGRTVTPSSAPGDSEPYTIQCTNGVLVPSDSETITVNTSLLNPVLTVMQSGSAVKTVKLESDVTVRWNTNGGSETACSLSGGGLVGYSSPGIPGSGDPLTGETSAIQINGRTTFRIQCGTRTGEATVEVVPIGWES